MNNRFQNGTKVGPTIITLLDLNITLNMLHMQGQKQLSTGFMIFPTQTAIAKCVYFVASFVSHSMRLMEIVCHIPQLSCRACNSSIMESQDVTLNKYYVS